MLYLQYNQSAEGLCCVLTSPSHFHPLCITRNIFLAVFVAEGPCLFEAIVDSVYLQQEKWGFKNQVKISFIQSAPFKMNVFFC